MITRTQLIRHTLVASTNVVAKASFIILRRNSLQKGMKRHVHCTVEVPKAPWQLHCKRVDHKTTNYDFPNSSHSSIFLYATLGFYLGYAQSLICICLDLWISSG